MGPDSEILPANFLSIRNIILAIIAILTAWNTYTTTVTKNKIDFTKSQLDTTKAHLEIQSAGLNNLIRKKEFDNNLKFKIYEEVKDAVVHNDPQKQNVVVLIVNEMLADDSVFKTKLTNILLGSPNLASSVKTNIVETQKVEASFITTDAVKNKTGFTIDIFYLEDIISEAKPRAEKIEVLLKQKYPSYTIRLRLLPRSINAKSGYAISRNEIRYENKEQPIVEEILSAIVDSNVFQLEQPYLHRIRYHTNNYISLFVRNM